jgi:DHA1 family tetracycline resistance protein-like MFS transporter
LLNLLFGAFVLPESLDRSRRRQLDLRGLNPLRSLGNVIRSPAIQALVVVHVLLSLAGQTHPSIWTLYTQHRFGWSASEVGLSLAAVGVLSAFSQGFLAGKLVARFGERKILVWGALGEALSYVMFGLAVNGTMLYLALLFGSLFWASQPALQSLVSREVPPQRQGELQGSLMSLASLTSIVNPIAMTALFSLTSDRAGRIYLPGSPYLAGAALLAAAWVVATRWEKAHRA